MEKREHNNWWSAILFFVCLVILTVVLNYTIRRPVLELNISESFSTIAATVEREDWVSVEDDLSTLTEKWGKARARVSFNAGTDSVRDFEVALARLEKMVHLQDRGGALGELATLRVLWAEFLSF